MNLLAFDTATAWVSVALWSGGPDGVVTAQTASDSAMKHGETLAPLIEQALKEAGIRARDLTEIVVGVGPGPFTGLRVGLTTAQTMGFALSIPVGGVVSLDILAAEYAGTAAPSDEFMVATDARRKEVYWARYDATGHRLGEPAVDRPAEVATADPVVGQGAVLYPDALPNAVGPTRPSAAWLARAWASGAVAQVGLEPLYLRRPDAVPGPNLAVPKPGSMPR